MKILAWVLGVPAALLALLFIIGLNSGPPSEKSRARDSISLCWEQQGKKSNDPGTARFIASTCEKMEADFRERFKTNP